MTTAQTQQLPVHPPATPVRSRFAPVTAWGPALISVAAMAVVGGYGIGRSTVGWDEFATVSAATRDVGEIMTLARNFDGVIAPYYLFMHYWTGLFGISEVALRLPSAIGMAIGVGAAAELGRRLLGPAVGLLAGLILCTIPSLTTYAQEARAYGLAFCFATVATLLCHLALQRGGGWRWSAYAVAVALAGVSHLFTLAVLAGHAVLVAYEMHAGRRRALRGWLLAVSAGVLPCLPLAWLGAHQRQEQLGWLGPVTWRTLTDTPAGLFGTRSSLTPANPYIVAVAFLVIGLALAVRGHGTRRVTELAGLAVLPPLLLIGVALIHPVWTPRYVLGTLAPLCILAAAAVVGPAVVNATRRQRLASLARSGLVLAVLGALTLVIAPVLRAPAAHQGGDYRALARVITERHRDGDVIVYAVNSGWAPRGGVNYYVPAASRPADPLLKQTAAQAGQLGATEYPIGERLGSPQQVWYLRAVGPGVDPLTSEPHVDLLKRDYRIVGRWESGWLHLILWERSAPPA